MLVINRFPFICVKFQLNRSIYQCLAIAELTLNFKIAATALENILKLRDSANMLNRISSHKHLVMYYAFRSY